MNLHYTHTIRMREIDQLVARIQTSAPNQQGNLTQFSSTCCRFSTDNWIAYMFDVPGLRIMHKNAVLANLHCYAPYQHMASNIYCTVTLFGAYIYSRKTTCWEIIENCRWAYIIYITVNFWCAYSRGTCSLIGTCAKKCDNTECGFQKHKNLSTASLTDDRLLFAWALVQITQLHTKPK